jgi:hypothetical protein
VTLYRLEPFRALGMSVWSDVIEHPSIREEFDHLQASSQVRTSFVLGSHEFEGNESSKVASIARRVSRGTISTWWVMGGVIVGRFD